jgi:hypothetical protein
LLRFLVELDGDIARVWDAVAVVGELGTFENPGILLDGDEGQVIHGADASWLDSCDRQE